MQQRSAQDRSYLVTRILTALISLLYSLIYSKQLGLNNRSILTLIMSVCLVFTVLTMSGVSLHTRRSRAIGHPNQMPSSYFGAIVFLSIVNASLSVLLILGFGKLHNSILPLPLLIVTFIYSISSSMSYGLSDGLLLLGLIRMAVVFDVFVIFLQLLSFAFFRLATDLSIIICVLFSFIFSYFVFIISAFASLFRGSHIRKAKFFAGILELMLNSKEASFIAIANELSGKIDRVFIGYILPVTDLGKYAIITGISQLTRTVPEVLSKTTLLFKKDYLKYFFNKRIRGFLILALFIPITTTAINKAITIFLGREWTFPLWIALLLVGQEFTRGFSTIIQANSIVNKPLRVILRYTYLNLLSILIVFPIVLHFGGLGLACLINILSIFTITIRMRNYVHTIS